MDKWIWSTEELLRELEEYDSQKYTTPFEGVFSSSSSSEDEDNEEF